MNLRRLLPVLFLFPQLSCYTGPRPVNYSPRLWLTMNQLPKRLWITLKDGRQQVLVGPRIMEDTLFGWSEDGREDLSVAVSDVSSLKARRLSVVRSAVIPVILVTGGVLAFTVIKNASGDAALSEADSGAAELNVSVP